jgi:hypothetical protein
MQREGNKNKNKKNYFALFCVSVGVEPENGLFSYFFYYISKFSENPRHCEEEFNLVLPTTII